MTKMVLQILLIQVVRRLLLLTQLLQFALLLQLVLIQQNVLLLVGIGTMECAIIVLKPLLQQLLVFLVRLLALDVGTKEVRVPFVARFTAQLQQPQQLPRHATIMVFVILEKVLVHVRLIVTLLLQQLVVLLVRPQAEDAGMKEVRVQLAAL